MQKQQELLEQQKIKMQEQHRMEKEIMENERLEQIDPAFLELRQHEKKFVV